jgi:hypothetical protein
MFREELRRAVLVCGKQHVERGALTDLCIELPGRPGCDDQFVTAPVLENFGEFLRRRGEIGRDGHSALSGVGIAGEGPEGCGQSENAADRMPGDPAGKTEMHEWSRSR